MTIIQLFESEKSRYKMKSVVQSIERKSFNRFHNEINQKQKVLFNQLNNNRSIVRTEKSK